MFFCWFCKFRAPVRQPEPRFSLRLCVTCPRRGISAFLRGNPALLKTVLSSTRWPRFAETPAAVYAPWALVLKPSQNTVCQRGSAKIDLMSRAFWQVADLPKRPRNRCSRLRAGLGWPETPSAVYAKLRIVAPVYAPRGGLEKRRNVSRPV